MAVLRSADTQPYGSEHLAAIGLLVGIMCTMLALNKFKFNLDFSRSTSLQETPTPLVSGGVYRTHSNDQFGNSSITPPVHRSINPAMVQLPPAPPPLPNSPPPTLPVHSSGPRNPVVQLPPPDVIIVDRTVSLNPRGGALSRMKSTDLQASGEANTKPSKKEQKLMEKQEKERIKMQKQKDKVIIAEILKEDSERIEREALLLKERVKEKAKSKTDKSKADKSKVDKKTDKSKVDKNKPAPKPAEIKPPVQRAENPLAQINPAPSTDTLRSTFSTSSGPPPYSESKPPQQVTPSEIDSSGNTSFSKPVAAGTWDMVSQHRQQIKRPGKEAVASIKIDNSHYDVSGGKANRPTNLEISPPRKSLYV